MVAQSDRGTDQIACANDTIAALHFDPFEVREDLFSVNAAHFKGHYQFLFAINGAYTHLLVMECAAVCSGIDLGRHTCNTKASDSNVFQPAYCDLFRYYRLHSDHKRTRSFHG